MKRDYYAVLGVARDEGEVEIKKAFRRLALACHPDIKPGGPACEARFKEGAEAYEVLSDPCRRAAYDREGFDGLRGLPMTDFAGTSMDELFRAFFGPSAFGVPLHPYTARRIARALSLGGGGEDERRGVDA